MQGMGVSDRCACMDQLPRPHPRMSSVLRHGQQLRARIELMLPVLPRLVCALRCRSSPLVGSDPESHGWLPAGPQPPFHEGLDDAREDGARTVAYNVQMGDFPLVKARARRSGMCSGRVSPPV